MIVPHRQCKHIGQVVLQGSDESSIATGRRGNTPIIVFSHAVVGGEGILLGGNVRECHGGHHCVVSSISLHQKGKVRIVNLLWQTAAPAIQEYQTGDNVVVIVVAATAALGCMNIEPIVGHARHVGRSRLRHTPRRKVSLQDAEQFDSTRGGHARGIVGLVVVVAKNNGKGRLVLDQPTTQLQVVGGCVAPEKVIGRELVARQDNEVVCSSVIILVVVGGCG
mmetsp:Transcript_29020/g.79626  ORF Transcript_29020/g.79626 Transcript_29020/m.79626 type:complete len:222 (-) Transcript_29020:437-1102(-)